MFHRLVQHARSLDRLPAPLSLAMRPMPAPVLAFILRRFMEAVMDAHPRLFGRLGDYAGRRFLIVADDTPFAVLIRPDPAMPELDVFRHGRLASIQWDARITGSLPKLIEMVEGNSDGDALFFSRDLTIEGDTEAVLALRNTIDDMEISLLDEAVNMLGPLVAPVRNVRKAERFA